MKVGKIIMNSKDNFMFPKKSDLTKIKISDITVELPDLKNCDESKSIVIGKWLSGWIKSDLASGKVQVNNIIPSKSTSSIVCYSVCPFYPFSKVFKYLPHVPEQR